MQQLMKATPYEVLDEQEAELRAQLKVIIDYKKAFYPNYSPQSKHSDQVMLSDPEPVSNPPADAPKIDDQNSNKAPTTISGKVLYALREVGTGKTKDVANKLIGLYPEYSKNHKKAAKDARLNVSALAIKGQIEVVDKGEGNSGYTYRVKE